METQGDSNIDYLLSLRKDKNLEIEDDLTNKIIRFDYTKYPGISLKYLESRKKDLECGSWNEYNILFNFVKYKDTPEYLSYILKNLGNLLEDISNGISLDVIGIQEIDCSKANNYYILIYIFSDGRDKKEEETFDY